MEPENREKPASVVTAEMVEAASKRPQAEGLKARIGFIGIGWWATSNHLPVLKLRQDVDLVCACGLDEEINKKVQEDFGFLGTTTDYNELLEKELDGVVIASPHPWHGRHAIAALRAGCHIYVEKPFTTNVEEAREIIRISEEQGLHVVVSHGWHYRPLIMKAKSLMEEGLVGEVEHIVCHMASPGGKSLFCGEVFEYPGSYMPVNADTYADPVASEGGYGQGQLCHALGLLFWLTDLRPQTVFAKMSEVGSRVDMYDAITATFANGAIGVISGAASLPDDARYQVDIRVFGSEGMLNFDLDRERVDLLRLDGKHRLLEVELDEGAYQCDGPIHNFVELILGLDAQNLSPGITGMRAVEILDAAYRSSRSGKEETI